LKAMILAAGHGSRLRPLTNDRPKALVEVGGKPMLSWVIGRLSRHGFTDLIINASHFAEQIEAYAASYDHPHVSLTVSMEKETLGTGGGVKKAAWFFNDGAPFLVHNVDVLTDLDLGGLMNAHRSSDAQATLAVKERKSSRRLLFDERNQLCGWRSVNPAQTRWARPPEGQVTTLPFMAIYAMSPVMLDSMQGPPHFSIIDYFLDQAARDRKLRAFRADNARWADLGKRERLLSAEKLFGKEWFTQSE